jgi:hypothetical protein
VYTKLFFKKAKNYENQHTQVGIWYLFQLSLC